MKLGIIGVGVIGSALATGFCESPSGDISVILSPRGRDRAAALKKKYPEKIHVAATNQEVVDAADWVILSILPTQAEEVVRALSFRPDQRLINLVSTLGLEELRSLTGPLALMADVVPLPFNARRIGPVVLYPPLPDAKSLLSLLGDVVEVAEPEQMAVLRTVTALMSPFYELTAQVVDFCVAHGLGEKEARRYTTSFFGALSAVAGDYTEGLHQLAQEMTPGGLNWQALTALTKADAFAVWQEALEPILQRVTKH